jgi:aspartokinase/homoserine dehydrogenase 1
MGYQNVFIMGATGNIGQALISQIYDYKDHKKELHANPTRIVGLACRSRIEYNASGFSEDYARSFRGTGKGQDDLDPIKGFVSQSGLEEKIIFIDVTAAGDEMTELHKQIMQETHHGIVTANKNPLVADMKTFNILASEPGRYGYRCSVMAGAEAVNKVRDLRDLGDMAVRIEGIFSGTLAYICSELETGRAFSDIVRQAKDKGYTEPNPANDLDGSDAAKKLLILARTAGYFVDYEDTQINPFVPQEFLNEKDPDALIQQLKALDKDFRKRAADAKKRDDCLRYIARFELINGQPLLNVGLEEVPKDSDLGSTHGRMNQIAVVSKTHPKEQPYIVKAAGAGKEITAQNIRRDLLDQIPQRVISNVSQYLPVNAVR